MKLSLMMVPMSVFVVVSVFGSKSWSAEDRAIHKRKVEVQDCAYRKAKELIKEVQEEQATVEAGNQIKAN